LVANVLNDNTCRNCLLINYSKNLLFTFLAIFAVLPALVFGTIVQTDRFALFFGGTSLLIMVGVIMDTVQQVNTYLLNHHYDGLMQSKLSRTSGL